MEEKEIYIELEEQLKSIVVREWNDTLDEYVLLEFRQMVLEYLELNLTKAEKQQILSSPKLIIHQYYIQNNLNEKEFLCLYRLYKHQIFEQENSILYFKLIQLACNVCLKHSNLLYNDLSKDIQFEIEDKFPLNTSEPVLSNINVIVQEVLADHCWKVVLTNHQLKSAIVDLGQIEIHPGFKAMYQYVKVGNTLQLHQIQISPQGKWIPKYIIYEPDYLVNISGIAECFASKYTLFQIHFLKRFLEAPSSIALTFGNLINSFLDHLVQDINASFDDVFKSTFKLMPFEYLALNDEELEAFMDKAKKHFKNIRNALTRDFSKIGLEHNQLTLEPSFYSQYYGLSGRLDILGERNNNLHIIELKSSTKAPHFGMWKNHEMQALLYQLLVESISHHPNNGYHIFYSASETHPLRSKPFPEEDVKKALALRNQLVASEYFLAHQNAASIAQFIGHYFNNKSVKEYSILPSFIQNDWKGFVNGLKILTKTEKAYFFTFVNFIANEHLITKLGYSNSQRRGSQAALWTQTTEEKKQAFGILHTLKFNYYEEQNSTAIVWFDLSDTTPIANFRKGDIVVIYPNQSNELPTNYQLLKGSVFKYTNDKIGVLLRQKLTHQRHLNAHSYWAIERDILDSGFQTLYSNLAQLPKMSRTQRDLLLGFESPSFIEYKLKTTTTQLHQEQRIILEKALGSKDYFLIIGPPGTGKTKVMLKTLINELYFHSSESILLTAYTNRAVDEICEAIELAFEDSEQESGLYQNWK